MGSPLSTTFWADWLRNIGALNFCQNFKSVRRGDFTSSSFSRRVSTDLQKAVHGRKEEESNRKGAKL